MKLRDVQYNQSYTLPGEQGERRTRMTNIRSRDGITQVYSVPYAEGRYHPTRGYWVDWDTEVTVTGEPG